MLIFSISIMVVKLDKSSEIYVHSIFGHQLINPSELLKNPQLDNICCTIPNIPTSCREGILSISISDHYTIFCISINETLFTCVKSEVSAKRKYLLKYIIFLFFSALTVLTGGVLLSL